MSDDGTVKTPALNSLSAYLQWRDSMIADGVSDVNPFRVWSAGVRYATLTDAEREAIRSALQSVKMVGTEKCFNTLRGLLERQA